MTEESPILHDLVSEKVKPAQLTTSGSSAPAVTRGKLTVPYPISRMEKIQEDASQSLRQQQVSDKRRGIQGWEEMKCKPPFNQQVPHILMEKLPVDHMLRQHLGEYKIELAEVCRKDCADIGRIFLYPGGALSNSSAEMSSMV
jgi:hypothetical protein